MTIPSVRSIFLFGISFFILLHGLFYIGVFSLNKYLAKAEGTTGPDFSVILGESKLKRQMPDTISNQDCEGLMVSNNKIEEVLKSDGANFPWDNYYILTGKVVGVKRSDGIATHPLIDVTSYYHISKITFWMIALFDLLLLLYCLFHLWKIRLK